MALGEFHIGDEGTQIIATILDQDSNIVSLVGFTSLSFRFSRQDGTFFDRVASLFSDGTDGKIKYITVASDLNVKGKWRIQGRVSLPNGNWSSNIYNFDVYENL